MLASHLLEVLNVWSRHLLDGHFDDNTVEFVQSQLALIEAKELSLDSELTRAVMPNPSLTRLWLGFTAGFFGSRWGTTTFGDLDFSCCS